MRVLFLNVMAASSLKIKSLIYRCTQNIAYCDHLELYTKFRYNNNVTDFLFTQEIMILTNAQSWRILSR